MTTLSRDQIDALRRTMDHRWDRELREIRSVAERSIDDRLQQPLAGRAADRLDEALAEIWQCIERDREIGYERPARVSNGQALH